MKMLILTYSSLRWQLCFRLSTLIRSPTKLTVKSNFSRNSHAKKKQTNKQTNKQKHFNGGTMTHEVSSRVTPGLRTFEVLHKLIVRGDFEDLWFTLQET